MVLAVLMVLSGFRKFLHLEYGISCVNGLIWFPQVLAFDSNLL